MRQVFFSIKNCIIEWAYRDVIEDPNTEYYDFPEKLTGIKKYILTRKGANLTPFFLKRFVYGSLLHYEFLRKSKRNDNILFVFTCQYYLLTYTFFKPFLLFLKKYYHNARFAFYYNDVVETRFPELIGFIKENFDLVLSFDKRDVKKYGLEYYEEVYSKNNLIDDESIIPFDVFFVGSDRDRFDILLSVFKKVSDEDKSAVFYISNMSSKNKDKILLLLPGAVEIEPSKIVYKNSILYVNVYCPYQKTLALINKCKCIVEVTMSVQAAETLRLAEAVVYKKKLITNCKTVKERDYYRTENIFIIRDEDIETITGKEYLEFLEMPMVDVEHSFSPLGLVDYCKKRLFDEENT